MFNDIHLHNVHEWHVLIKDHNILLVTHTFHPQDDEPFLPLESKQASNLYSALLRLFGTRYQKLSLMMTL